MSMKSERHLTFSVNGERHPPLGNFFPLHMGNAVKERVM